MVKLTGKLNGNKIELDGNPGLPEGSRVEVSIEKVSEETVQEKLAALKKLFGVWKDDEEITQIYKEIIESRKRDVPREVDFDATP